MNKEELLAEWETFEWEYKEYYNGPEYQHLREELLLKLIGKIVRTITDS